MGRKFPERTSVENSTMGSVGFYWIELLRQVQRRFLAPGQPKADWDPGNVPEC